MRKRQIASSGDGSTVAGRRVMVAWMALWSILRLSDQVRDVARIKRCDSPGPSFRVPVGFGSGRAEEEGTEFEGQVWPDDFDCPRTEVDDPLSVVMLRFVDGWPIDPARRVGCLE